MSVRELHKSLVSATKYSGLNEARDEDDNIIISDSTLRSLFPPQFKKICQDTRLCVVVNVAYLPKLCIRNYYHGVIVILELKYLIQDAQYRRSGGKANLLYETFKNAFMPHGCHIYAKAHDMGKATMCAKSHYNHALPHWKCVLRCCAQCPSINIPDQETDDNNPKPSPSTRFHIYHLIARRKNMAGFRYPTRKFVKSVNRILLQ